MIQHTVETIRRDRDRLHTIIPSVLMVVLLVVATVATFVVGIVQNDVALAMSCLLYAGAGAIIAGLLCVVVTAWINYDATFDALKESVRHHIDGC